METGNLKNMVVLKNVPSNMIEEAMIVLKKNIKIKETEMQKYIESEVSQNQSKSSTKDYIIKEAEMIISHYMSKIENNKKKEMLNKKINEKYQKMKKYLYLTSFICIVELIVIFIK